eukprot:TRINITY_DN106401_c0_g1_i1.p1 TRINITY_DN106401_c0_g1~~TRINITY_DN106401_c0_g1_i1.p1  ORF type:complete len:139 (-),score=19.95 TRINITY_DN106401_c0_g1_i1:201-617(-)
MTLRCTKEPPKAYITDKFVQSLFAYPPRSESSLQALTPPPQGGELVVSKVIKIQLEDVEEEVQLHADHGPGVLQRDGSISYVVVESAMNGRKRSTGSAYSQKSWGDLTSTERNVMLHLVAKKNRALREFTGLPASSYL